MSIPELPPPHERVADRATIPPPPSVLAESDSRALAALRHHIARPAAQLTCAQCHAPHAPRHSSWRGEVVWEPSCACGLARDAEVA